MVRQKGGNVGAMPRACDHQPVEEVHAGFCVVAIAPVALGTGPAHGWQPPCATSGLAPADFSGSRGREDGSSSEGWGGGGGGRRRWEGRMERMDKLDRLLHDLVLAGVIVI